MTQLTAHSDRCALVTELIGVIRDANALETLAADRIGALVTVTESAGHILGSFPDEVRHAWEMVRPPSNSDLEVPATSPWFAPPGTHVGRVSGSRMEFAPPAAPPERTEQHHQSFIAERGSQSVLRGLFVI